MAVSRINEAGLNVNQYGNRNLIINGAMKVAQRGTSSTGLGAAAGYFTCDRWRVVGANTAGRFTMSQTADGPSGLSNCLKLDCTTADTSIASNELLTIRQTIEGQDVQSLAKGTSDAKEITFSFYVKANAAFTFGVEVYDADNNRQITKLFTTSTGWVRHEITFPADTTGALDDDNAGSLIIQFWLHAGSDYTSGTLNSTSWANVTTANRAGGIGSFYSSTSNEFLVTGVQLEVGDTATDFEHRTFGDELQRCRRYFQRVEYASGSMEVGLQSTTDNGVFNLKYSPKRVDPTITLPTPAVVTGANTISALTSGGAFRSSSGSEAVSADRISKDNSRVILSSFSASGSVGDATWIYFSTNTSVDPHVLIDAEL